VLVENWFICKLCFDPGSAGITWAGYGPPVRSHGSESKSITHCVCVAGAEGGRRNNARQREKKKPLCVRVCLLLACVCVCVFVCVCLCVCLRVWRVWRVWRGGVCRERAVSGVCECVCVRVHVSGLCVCV